MHGDRPAHCTLKCGRHQPNFIFYPIKQTNKLQLINYQNYRWLQPLFAGTCYKKHESDLTSMCTATIRYQCAAVVRGLLHRNSKATDSQVKCLPSWWTYGVCGAYIFLLVNNRQFPEASYTKPFTHSFSFLLHLWKRHCELYWIFTDHEMVQWTGFHELIMRFILPGIIAFDIPLLTCVL